MKGKETMIKKSIYPKTKRLGKENPVITITEKLDGSNLAFFKKDGVVHIATRSDILNLEEDKKHFKKILYKGMQDWLDENLEHLTEDLYEGAVIIGEWIAMGKLNYPNLNKRFYMFAKGNLDEELNLIKINYTHDFFQYCFNSREIPEYIGVVPIVKQTIVLPIIEEMDALYEQYREDECRDIEGFVINNNNSISKYVRMKNGHIEPHHI